MHVGVPAQWGFRVRRYEIPWTGSAKLCETATVRLMTQPTDEKGLSLMPTRMLTSTLPPPALACPDPEAVACLEPMGDVPLLLPAEIDCSNSSDVAEALCRLVAGNPRTICVDLGGVTFMGSSGIAACIKAQRCARLAGYDMVFVNPTGPVAQVIQILGLEGVLLHGRVA